MVHSGHRERMRSKFMLHGERIFDTYELLEMLLYNVIPRTDTNPIAKSLLSAFGSLDGVLRAEAEELSTVVGIGVRTAEFIREVGRLTALPLEGGFNEMPKSFESSSEIGDFFLDYFRDEEDYAVAIMLLDNSMRLITVERVYGGDLASGAVSSQRLVGLALKNGAAAAIIAHTHPHGPLCPTMGDMATAEMLERELLAVGIVFTESYVISGGKFVSVSTKSSYKLYSDTTKLNEYLKKCKSASACTRIRGLAPVVLPILRFTLKDDEATDAAARLEKHLHNVRFMFETDGVAIRNMTNLPGGTVNLVRLLGAIASRRVTDKTRRGAKINPEDAERYFKGVFIDKPKETVYLMSLDQKSRLISVSCIGEGTVNSSAVIPRNLLETAVCEGAKRVYIAHNHPRGTSEPSNDDIGTTVRLGQVFSGVGIELLGQYVVAGNEARKITPPDMTS